MHRSRLLPALALLALLPFAGCVHDHAHPHAHPHDGTAGGTPLRTIRVTQAPDGSVNPWNHLDFRNDPNAFQFAIVSDRSGGIRAGVFEKAVGKLNLLQPEFVMSVGDLIEGYSTDVTEVNRQWDEFQGIIKRLEMPFFYVPGNHDQSNPVQARIWRERFGASYHSFVYRDVLFLCINAQDGTMHRIDEAQVQWVRDTLAAHPEARWTLLFLHTPLWEEEYTDKSGWPAIEAALQGRKYTVFAGHYHDYLRRVRHDSRYYILATTGGGSALRGPAYGEFDQVAWVTMTNDGPLVANLLLDGIRADDIRTPESRGLVQAITRAGAVQTEILWHNAGETPAAHAELRCVNPLDLPVKLTYHLTTPAGIRAELSPRFAPAPDGRQMFVIQPRSTRSLSLRFDGALPTHPHQAQVAASFLWQADFSPAGMEPIRLQESLIIPIVPRLTPARLPAVLTVDASAADWPAGVWYDFAANPHFLKGIETWTGPSDCSYRLGVARDDANLYVIVDVTDDEVVSLPDVPPWNQDGIELRIDSRPPEVRQVGRLTSERGLTFIASSPAPAGADENSYLRGAGSLPKGTRHRHLRTATGYTFEVAIPLQAFTDRDGDAWKTHGLRLNVAVNDRDGQEQAQLWWQPDWRTTANIPASGTFFLE